MLQDNIIWNAHCSRSWNLLYDPGAVCFSNMLLEHILGSVHKYFGGGAGQNGGGAKKVLSYQKGGTKKFSIVNRGGQKSLVKLKV